MTSEQNGSLVRLWKRHAPGKRIEATSADGERLVAAQSVRDAIAAALIVIILFSVLWAVLSILTNRIFPWMTMILGVALGHAVRRAGRGVNWRFPLIAGVLAVVGALIGNIVVAAAFTADEVGIGTLQVLRAVTTMTLPYFISEVITPADAVFALFAAAIAAFYANPRLTREQFFALKLWEQEQDRE
jgi:hypothetical protein